MSIELKPCPCCGSSNVVFEQYKKDGYRIQCKSCALKREQRSLRYGMDWLEIKMKSAWNDRISDKHIELKSALLSLVSCDEIGNWYTDMPIDTDVTDIVGKLLAKGGE